MTRFRRAVVVLSWVSVVVVAVAYVASPTYRRALGAGFWMLYGTLQLFLLARSKTLGWGQYLRFLAIGSLVVAPVAVVAERLLMAIGGWDVGDPASAVWIAGLVEETVKVVPLLVLFAFLRKRTERLATVDFALIGFATGAGFQLVEDGLRRVANVTPSNGLWLGSGPPPGTIRYEVFSLFPGWSDVAHAHSPGHFLTAGFIGAAVGLAFRLRRRFGIAIWIVPVAAWVMSVIDHATYNATAEGDDLPGLIATLHAHWGAGREVLVLFLVFVVVAQVLDYRAVKPFGRSRWLQPGSELLISTAALCATSTANWSNTLAMLRLRRADAYAAQWQPALSPPSLAYVTRLRTALSSMAVVVLLCIGLASMYDQHVDVQFIARVVDAVGAWWQGLPWWQQVLFSVAVGAFFGAWMPAAWAILSALAVDTAIDLAQEYYEKGDSFRMEEVTLGHLLAATVGALLHHTLPATVIEKLAHSAGKLLKQEMVWIGQELDRAAAQGVVAAERDFELAAIRAQRALNNAPVELSERMTRIKELVEANLRRLRGMGPPEGH